MINLTKNKSNYKEALILRVSVSPYQNFSATVPAINVEILVLHSYVNET
jgi:hypothetical protein